MKRIVLCVCVGVILFQLVFMCTLHYFYSGAITRIVPATLRNSTTSPRECWPTTTFCGDILSEPSWIAIDHRNSKFVFSAFYDPVSNIIIIVGLNSRFNGGVCQIWYTSDNMTFLAKEESGIELYRTLPETHGRRYSAVLYRCTSKSKKKPAFISFVETDRFISKGLLVKSIEIPKRYKHRFTVCLMPLHNNFNDSYALVQWIELNLILGADKFRVYNHSSSQSIKTILDMYSGRNITEVVQWSIPVTDVHYFGQVAALQDCLYQNKADSEFIVNLDLDEYIVPRVEHIDTWSDLIANSPAEAFLFRNTFFVANSREHNYSEKAIAQQLRLSTLLMTRHEPKIWSHTLRSKYIARTSKARSLMIHDVPWDAIGVQAERVQSDRAMVFHFQHAASEPNNGTTYIIDETVRKKYGEMLIRNVQRAWNRILRG